MLHELLVLQIIIMYLQQAADIKVLGALSRDDLKKLCGDNFPEWISFPQFEQVSSDYAYVVPNNSHFI